MKKQSLFIIFCFFTLLSASAQTVNTETFTISAGFSWRPSATAEYFKIMNSGNTWYVNLGRDSGTGYMDFGSNYNAINGYTGSIELCGRFTNTDPTKYGHDTWGYLRTDTLTGGIDSIAFEWHASDLYANHKLKFLVQICTSNNSYTLTDDNLSLYSPQETLSNDTVIYNMNIDYGTGSYYPYQYPITATNKHHVFSCKNIHISGKYMIKIWNFSYSYSDANGTIATAIGGSHKFDIANLKRKNYPTQVLNFNTQSVSKTIGASDFTNSLTTTPVGTVTYSSSNQSCATVDPSSGLVHIIAQGATTITASIPNTTNFAATTVSYQLAVGPVTALQNTSINSALFTISPTITSDIIRINTKEKQYDINVYNQLGDNILNGNNLSLLSVEKLAKGLYFIRLESSKGAKETYRFIKK